MVPGILTPIHERRALVNSGGQAIDLPDRPPAPLSPSVLMSFGPNFPIPGRDDQVYMDDRELELITMTSYILVIALALVFVYLGARFSRAYFRLRGTRVVTCPTDHSHAAVDIDARKAATTAVFGSPTFALTSCSHWPERHACGRECLREIEASPVDCLVRTRLAAWYAGRSCVQCQRAFGEIDWYERRPALLSPDGLTRVWSDVDPAHLDDVLRVCKPVCFDCHVAETFRRTHPELVLDNPYSSLPPGRSA